ncbi:UNVERIFIED_CONTAM: hypothetical protein Sradi_5095600 [Sesamum radiatum]|uniref:Reverse transcriptase domain-containing protein n=1 Tax=Sesamum radiatum TaxID=300843 RepID=A0AAW2M2N8_SESRA
MDGSFGYNQIRMAPTDEELTAFRIPKGYCYKVMPFRLKNASTTYQRVMQRIFDGMLHKNMECYIDDLVVKSKKREDHLHNLRKVFERLRRYQLKMNPSKCAFGVTSGEFLGFIVRQRGIEIEQANIDAILRMPKLRNIHELKSWQGKLAYLRRFISNLAGHCQTFSQLMNKGVPFQWMKLVTKHLKIVKWQVLANFLADHPMHAEWELSDDLPDEDALMIEVTLSRKIYFDGASHKEGAVIYDGGLTPDGGQLISFITKANLIYQPPEPLHPTVVSWLFNAWGLDVVGPMIKSSDGHLYILNATDYFSKWVKVVPLKEVKKENIIDSICTQIIYCFGEPSLLKKVVSKSKCDWHERIGEALWAYNTTVRKPTQATPYALVYRVETVLPLEQKISSLRIAIQERLTEEENAQT